MRLGFPQHGAASVNSLVDDTEVVEFGEAMFVNQMKTPLLRGGAFPFTVLNEAAVCFLTFGLQLFS
jgi:hypothetical protein